MYIVTGGAGFIGSNLIHEMNRRGYNDILVVDDLTDSSKFLNLNNTVFFDYLDKEDFLNKIKTNIHFKNVRGVFHLGACSNTMEYDGRKMMMTNYEYSKILFHWAVASKIPIVYASSAAVYGANRNTEEISRNESPLNIYGFSKLLLDQYVRRCFDDIQTTFVGLRFFNVYGSAETHKGKMASMAYQLYQQIKSNKIGKIFGGKNGYGDGEQKRDFIYVNDIVSIMLYFMEGKVHRGIYNAGTGQARSFNELGQAVIKALGYGELQYIPFPDELESKYQKYTEAFVFRLRQAGYDKSFIPIEEGVRFAVKAWETE